MSGRGKIYDINSFDSIETEKQIDLNQKAANNCNIMEHDIKLRSHFMYILPHCCAKHKCVIGSHEYQI